MASRLNLLFQTAPKQFLERTVLFTDELMSPESDALLRHKQVHFFDIQALQTRTVARVLKTISEYTVMPLAGYYVPPSGIALIPRDEPPHRFVFFPEFVGCRLMISPEGDDWLKVECEQGLVGSMPAPEKQKDTRCLDSFAYWDHTHGHLVGRIRATTVLVKEPGGPWTAYMQQIVGTAGFEVVRQLYSKTLRY